MGVMASERKVKAVELLLEKAGLSAPSRGMRIPTKAGWCLRQGLYELYQADDGLLAPLIDQHGVPGFYSVCEEQRKTCRHDATQDIKDPSTCFQSLCRIVAGQSVSGSSAQAAWKRLLQTTKDELTHETVLKLVQKRGLEGGLQKPVGLTRSKAASILDIATHFDSGTLSEDFFASADEEKVREALLSVKGLGPWSCDIFLMFYLERPNVLPLGDLGVRKGITKVFQLPCAVNNKSDYSKVRQRLQPYEPYQSLLTYYMWRAADTPKTTTLGPKKKKKKKKQTKAQTTAPSTPTKKRRTVARRVTP